MASNTSSSSLPNPYTPLAWLAPDAAYEFQVSRYLCVATFSAYVLDWIIAMRDEYRMLFKSRFRPIHIAYVGSRFGAFGYVLGCVLFQTAPIPDCQALEFGLATCFAVALSCTSALFYLRVCAVFHWNRVVVGLFSVLWIAVVSCSFTIVPAISGTHIGTTRYCINTGVAAYSASGVITNTLHDTLVFFAISWRLTYYSIGGDGDWWSRVRSFVKGDGLPRFSRMLLQDGQLYYFATVALNIISMTLLLAPGLSPLLRAMTTIPNVALENAMATRVFLAIHRGVIAESSQLPSSIVFRPDATNVTSSIGGARTYKPSSRAGMYGVQGIGLVSDHITVSKVVETMRDDEESIEMGDIGLSRKRDP